MIQHFGPSVEISFKLNETECDGFISQETTYGVLGAIERLFFYPIKVSVRLFSSSHRGTIYEEEEEEEDVSICVTSSGICKNRSTADILPLKALLVQAETESKGALQAWGELFLGARRSAAV